MAKKDKNTEAEDITKSPKTKKSNKESSPKKTKPAKDKAVTKSKKEEDKTKVKKASVKKTTSEKPKKPAKPTTKKETKISKTEKPKAKPAKKTTTKKASAKEKKVSKTPKKTTKSSKEQKMSEISEVNVLDKEKTAEDSASIPESSEIIDKEQKATKPSPPKSKGEQIYEDLVRTIESYDKSAVKLDEKQIPNLEKGIPFDDKKHNEICELAAKEVNLEVRTYKEYFLVLLLRRKIWDEIEKKNDNLTISNLKELARAYNKKELTEAQVTKIFDEMLNSNWKLNVLKEKLKSL